MSKKNIEKFFSRLLIVCLIPVLLFNTTGPVQGQTQTQTQTKLQPLSQSLDEAQANAQAQAQIVAGPDLETGGASIAGVANITTGPFGTATPVGAVSPAGATGTTQAVLKLAAGADPARFAQTNHLTLKKIGPLGYIVVALPGPVAAASLAALRQLPGVVSAGPDRTLKISAAGGPVGSGTAGSTVSDPFYQDQWDLTDVEAPQAWALGAAGQGITVAVIDTGVDLNHPDLKDNLVSGYNAISDSTDPQSLMDDNGHGTHVAGIIAAERNGLGVVGLAYKAKIMPIKAMDSNGEGDDVDIAAGIVWAADHGAKIINLSLGSGDDASVLQDAIQYATGKGVLIVAAAGNYDSGQSSAVAYPAADPNVLAITSVDDKNQISSFSCTGPQVALAAPGEDIVSTYWDPLGDAQYASMSGTSMAAPLVSATAALVWGQHPTWSATEVRQDLENAARRAGAAGRNNQYGYGIVDAYRSVAIAQAPGQLTSPAQVPFNGATVVSPNGAWKLAVPALTFNAQQTVSVNNVPAPADLPGGISSGSQAYAVQWSNPGTAPQRMLTLTAMGVAPPGSSTAEGYLFRWSGSRWLLVGGGQTTLISAGIYQPGIYRVGYLAPAANRLAGTNRLLTAIQVAEAAFPTGADTVIVARADDFPDALAGAPLAYKLDAPVLLTDPDQLDPAVLTAIRWFGPHQIIILGGTGAVSAAIGTELGQVAPVERLAGANRFATAAAIAQALGTTGQAVVVNGENFPDALAIAPGAAQTGVPILLSPAQVVDGQTAQVLRQLYVTDTVCAGGDAVLASGLLDQLPSPLRLAGADRYGTAAAVLGYYPPRSQLVYLATGQDFPDALTGGVLAASRATDIILVPPGGLTVAEQQVLGNKPAQTGIALGGQAVVPDSILSEFRHTG